MSATAAAHRPRPGVSETPHRRVVSISRGEFDRALDERLAELDLTREEFVRRGCAGELEDDRATMLWSMVGHDLT